LNAPKLLDAYGNKYSEVINQARPEFLQKIIPQLQGQAAKKLNKYDF
jgi:hypothetical protein